MTTQGPEIGRVARLSRRGVVATAGPDAEKFLNNLVTSDVSTAGHGRAVYAGLLTPQGKVLFDFIVFRNGDGFLIDLPREKSAEFVKRLGMYRLRAKLTLEERPSMTVVVGWEHATPPDGLAAPDPRLAALGWRAITEGDVQAGASEADYDAHRIALGIPEGGIDYAFGEVFPHDVDMDQLSGVDFTKGCYVGQEIVSRMEHRHTARRRVVMAGAAGAVPAAGTEIAAAGKSLGVLASSSGSLALALVRIDRVKEAIDRGELITAGATAVTLAIPPWARFAWPAATASEA